MSKTNALAELEQHAAEIRKDLAVPKQNEVFRLAVEAGYLAAMSDGEMDALERETLVKAVEVLSEGAVIEWETEQLIDDCAARAKNDGVAARTKAVGEGLKALGQGDAGLLFAAVIARVTKGVDKAEAETLKAVATAAGVSAVALKGIVKRATLT